MNYFKGILSTHSGSKLASRDPLRFEVIHQFLSFLIGFVTHFKILLFLLPLNKDLILNLAKVRHYKLHPVQVNITTVSQESLNHRLKIFVFVVKPKKDYIMPQDAGIFKLNFFVYNILL